jgi:Lrp/AsnC family leucine-responsive transcriptional regulator
MKLDTLDLRILAELQVDGSLSNVELARRVHLSPSPCLARVKALESQGVITRYVALANAVALGLGLSVFISISLKSQNKESLAEFERRIAEHDEVMECYLMTGDSDYLIRVALPDMSALEKFILEQLTPIPGIEKIRSSFALKQVRYKTALPLPGGSMTIESKAKLSLAQKLKPYDPELHSGEVDTGGLVGKERF